jgi:hypothetical protein
MAEDKKPKIDLKARLGKIGGQGPAGAIAPPVASNPGSIPAPPIAAPPIKSVVPPPGIPVGPPPAFGGAPIDPNNPLAAVAAQPFRAGPTPAPAAPPQPQRIEVDESAVQAARSGARKQGVVVAAIAAVLFAGVGYVAGGASEQGAGRKKSVKDAAELAVDVDAAKDALKKLGDKMEEGREVLSKQRKFPDNLARDLGGINVDFDGSKLAGRRFSGFPQETTSNLVELVTAVQQLNDKKGVLIGLLGKLQKPLSEQLSAPAGQQNVNYIVAVDRDSRGNPMALLARLTAPIAISAQKVDLPDTFTFTNPLGAGNTQLPRYRGGDIAAKPAAVYVFPKTFDAVCPSETQGAFAQLSAQMAGFIRDVRGEQAQGDVVMDSKPGLIEKADRLATALRKVGQD